jgi:alpha-1,3-glucan synthase
MKSTCVLLLLLLNPLINGLPHLDDYVDWNLNQNQNTINPLEYWGEWANHEFHPSPENWRMPFYTITLDRFINGDPTNDDANGTAWEHDPKSNQFRFGGDIKGLQDSLDYIEGMGVKVSLN